VFLILLIRPRETIPKTTSAIPKYLSPFNPQARHGGGSGSIGPRTIIIMMVPPIMITMIMIKISIRHKEVNFITVYLMAYSKTLFGFRVLTLWGFSAYSLFYFKTDFVITNVKNTMRNVTGIFTELIFINYPKKTGINTCG
jgi:hypothetical protein